MQPELRPSKAIRLRIDQANKELPLSVAQPPFPLQLFLPLQPLSLLLQPPCPLQSFLPLQECLAVPVVWPFASTRTPALEETLVLEEPSLCAVCAWRRTDVPPSKPATAAARARLCTVVVFMKSTFLGCCRSLSGSGVDDSGIQNPQFPPRPIPCVPI